MTLDYEVVDDVSSTDPTWQEWRELVESEGWTSDDHSVMELTPVLDTTRTVVAKDKDGKFIGSVVWNEYDGMAFIGFYLLRPEHRGKGMGSVIWKRAIGRMPADYHISLRAVPHMAPRYQSMTTPIMGEVINVYKMKWKNIYDITNDQAKLDANVSMVKGLCKEDYHKLEQFDRKVTARDRSQFLRKFHDLPFTRGTILRDAEGTVRACAAITPTSTDESHLLKLSPIYASSIREALTVVRPLIEYASEVDSEATILFHVLSGSRGAQDLSPLLTSYKVPNHGITLFSKPYSNPIDNSMLYIPHNNTGHFDA